MTTTNTEPSASNGTSGGIYWQVDGQKVGIQASIISEVLTEDQFRINIEEPLAAALSLTNGQEYAVVVSCAGADGSNQYSWNYGFSNTGYRGASTDAGSSWTGVINTQGQWFQAWGTVAGNDPVDTPSPADTVTGQQ
ncbi:hypothetical protein LCGC14_1711780, partial [marine sediment metagenome]